MKLPLIYAQLQIKNVDPARDRPFASDHQDFQTNRKSLAGTGSATTNGGWTVKDTVSCSSMYNRTVGGRTTSRGE